VLKASLVLKKEDQVYGQKVAEMAMKHSGEAFYALIQVHERITGISRELLCSIKELAENMRFEVLHGIVDCL